MTQDNQQPIETVDKAHNQTPTAGITPTGERLLSYFQRIENLEESKKEINEDIKEVFKELKSNGFDIKAVKALLKIRAANPSDLAEQQALIETYASAAGMQLNFLGD